MALSIRNPKVERLARELSQRTGTTMTEIIHKALLRYDKENAKASQERTKRILEIGRRCAAVPDKVPGTMDDIIGYDEFGAL